MDYQKFTDEFHHYKTRNPDSCISLGVNKGWDDLANPSSETFFEECDLAQDLINKANVIDRSLLDLEQNLDIDLAVLSLQYDIFSNTFSFNGSTQWQQLPCAGDGIISGIFLLFINDPRPAKERLDNIFSRISKVPWYLERLSSRLEKPVKRWVSMDLEKTSGLASFFQTIVDWAKNENYEKLSELKETIVKANKSILKYREMISSLPTTDSFHMGDKQARQLVKLRGIDLSLEELHELASSFLRKNSEVVESLRQKLNIKYELDAKTSTEELQSFLNHKYRVKLANKTDFKGVLNAYENERDKILKYINEKNLFPVFEQQDMLIMQTPNFMAPSIPAGAMMPPQPFREGTKKSLVYLTLSEELLDEHTELSIPAMMIHEGIPGHHLQLATAGNHKSVIRKHMNANDHAEGWTTMLEDYMLDIGYLGDLTDECRFIGKRDLARLGARVAIDLYFMTGDKKYLDVGIDLDFSSDDPFICAGVLLKHVSGFTDARVQGELNWYSQECGYPLSYLTGNKLVWDLKNEFSSKNPDKDPMELDRIFHDIYLHSGNMPVRFLRRLFKERNLL